MKALWLTKFRELSRSLSIRAGIYCLGAIIAALTAVLFAPYVPTDLANLLGGDAVDHILTILASTMLTIVAFSLSTLVATYSAIGSGAPPRATALIIEDVRAQSALSSFLGAFIFSVVSLVALSTKYYGRNGRVILFFMTIAVLSGVIWTVIRWIGQLSKLGQLGNVIDQVEKTAQRAIHRQRLFFSWQCQELPQVPSASSKIKMGKVGFIQTLDIEALSEIAEKAQTQVFIGVNVGQFVCPNTIIAYVHPITDDEAFARDIRSCIVIGKMRTFDEDPRFGFIVLSEIASKALSPAINDPGTAIHVISSLVRLTLYAREPSSSPKTINISNLLHLRPVTAEEIFDDAFRAIARDGAGIVEVAIFIQKALNALGEYPEFREAAKIQSAHALSRAQKELANSFDIDRVSHAIAEKPLSTT